MTKVENIKKKKFLTPSGIRTPKYLWQGVDDEGEEFTEMTKKGLQNHINRVNKLKKSHPELFINE